jgi:hypothetical protein
MGTFWRLRAFCHHNRLDRNEAVVLVPGVTVYHFQYTEGAQQAKWTPEAP